MSLLICKVNCSLLIIDSTDKNIIITTQRILSEFNISCLAPGSSNDDKLRVLIDISLCVVFILFAVLIGGCFQVTR